MGAMLILAVGPLVAACGGGEEEITRDRAVSLFAEGLAESSGLSSEDTSCLASAAIDEVGFDRMRDAVDATDGDFAAIDPTIQDALVGATLAALEPCGVDLAELTGG